MLETFDSSSKVLKQLMLFLNHYSFTTPSVRNNISLKKTKLENLFSSPSVLWKSFQAVVLLIRHLLPGYHVTLSNCPHLIGSKWCSAGCMLNVLISFILLLIQHFVLFVSIIKKIASDL